MSKTIREATAKAETPCFQHLSQDDKFAGIKTDSCDFLPLTKADLKHLQDGGVLYTNNGEASQYFWLEHEALRRFTPAEAAQVKPLSQEQVDGALEQGKRDAEAVRKQR